MKKLLLFGVLSLGLLLGAMAQWVAIPDTAFVSWLNSNGYVQCMNGNLMDTTCPAITGAFEIYVVEDTTISNLDGIQYFDSLSRLDCYNGHLTSLQMLPPLLTELNCTNNNLNFLPTLPQKLKFLNCGFNQLTVLPLLPNSINSLICSHNFLTHLDTLPKYLIVLYCDGNQLNVLPSLPPTLMDLQCSYNQLNTLPALPNYMNSLLCDSNQITTLPELPDTLYYFHISNNPDLLCLPELKMIGYFTFDNTGITCLPNYPLSIVYSNPPIDSLPLCDSINPNPCATTAISKIRNPQSDFRISPNPATNTVTISIDARLTDAVGQESMIGGTVTVSDVTGRKVLISNIEYRISNIEVGELANGVYFVTVGDKEGRSATKKLVVSK